MDQIALQPISRPIDQTVALPGSKSLTNRALLAAALSHGESRLEGCLFAEDTRLMLDCLTGLGISLRAEPAASRVILRGTGGHWPEQEADLFCGNAGTVIRFLTAACCAGHGTYRLDGVARMRDRPIGGLVNALRDLGAWITYEERDGGCPLTVHARGLRAGLASLDASDSSQYASALLMAAPLAAGDVMIEIEGTLPSRPYVRMTLAVMEAFGVSAVEDNMQRFIVPGQQTYAATTYAVEPDASAASYFLAAAALTGGRVTVSGLGKHSPQGDCQFVNVLRQMGCQADQTSKDTTVWGPSDGRLHGVNVNLGDMPDVAPTLAVLAAFADSPTRIRNVANLRLKESDRLHALATELGHLGTETEIHDDGITVRPSAEPTAGYINTYGDHRIAMSFALAGLRLDGIVIRDPGCVAKTFPDFFERWSALAK